jgi:hypothetical protein
MVSMAQGNRRTAGRTRINNGFSVTHQPCLGAADRAQPRRDQDADWIVDLGPGAGPEGGRVVAMGTPEEVAAVAESLTGRYLASILEQREHTV